MADDRLLRVLGEVQRRGAIGRGPLVDSIAHARQFVDALPVEPGVLIDLGSGGGLPGLVIAASVPNWVLHLIERRTKRADLLRYAVSALGVDDRVTVHACDVDDVGPGLHGCADVVTARSFASLGEVLLAARPLLCPTGRVIISDPPGGIRRLSGATPVDLGFFDAGRRGGVHLYEVIDRH